MARKYAKGVVPPCPGNPGEYDLVERDFCYYWRRKKGTYKPVVLNAALQQRSDAMKALSHYIRYLRHTLLPFMHPLPAGRLHNNLFKWLQQGWIETGTVAYHGLKQQELNATHTLQKTLVAVYSCTVKENRLQIMLQQPCRLPVARPGPPVTQFALEALLLWGTGDSIETLSRQSVVYDIKEGINSEGVFEFDLPQQPWMAVPKLVFFEGNQPASHPKYYGVRVVEVG